jgi:NhaA family Na+:H+ antiporter
MADAPPKLTVPVSERDHIKGSGSAVVTLVEYGDYQCPHCSQVHPIIQDLKKQMGDRLRVVYRHFPISSAHPDAQLASEAAEAAAAQGQFWEMHDILFSHQSALDYGHLVQYAAELGLDVAQFERDLQDHSYADRVREDFSSGVRSGVNGTPTFFINGLRYDGAWDFESMLRELEKPIGVQIRLLAQEFTRIQASGSLLLLLATIVALFWANSLWREAYFHLWETDLAITLGNLSLSEHLLEWVNDGLMVLFFFVVGLEIKREILEGELGSPKRAALPIAGAIGGLLFPALFYVVFNAGGPGASGWGIPMATDIAFTLGILVLLGSRVPLSLKVFFTALAIADDIGAVLVIALFYTAEISWLALGAGAVILIGLVVINRMQIYNPLPYAIGGIALWLAFLLSGVHPTLAGVLLAMVIPNRGTGDPKVFLAQCVTVLDNYEQEPTELPGSRQQAATQTLESITERMQSPSQRLERNLHPWTTYLILPLFALTNAGVTIGDDFISSLTNPVSLGIIFGLVLGKPLGISLFAWLAVRLGLAQLPQGVSWKQLISASALAGIGFTISLFITGRAFSDPVLLTSAKVGIMVASVLAGVIGWVALSQISPHYDRSTSVDAVPIQIT